MSVLSGPWKFHITNGGSTVDINVLITDKPTDNTFGILEVTKSDGAGGLLARGIRKGTGQGSPPDVKIVLIGASGGFEVFYGKCFRSKGSSIIDRIKGKRKQPTITFSKVSESSEDDDWTSEKTT